MKIKYKYQKPDDWAEKELEKLHEALKVKHQGFYAQLGNNNRVMYNKANFTTELMNKVFEDLFKPKS